MEILYIFIVSAKNVSACQHNQHMPTATLSYPALQVLHEYIYIFNIIQPAFHESVNVAYIMKPRLYTYFDCSLESHRNSMNFFRNCNSLSKTFSAPQYFQPGIHVINSKTGTHCQYSQVIAPHLQHLFLLVRGPELYLYGFDSFFHRSG